MSVGLSALVVAFGAVVWALLSVLVLRALLLRLPSTVFVLRLLSLIAVFRLAFCFGLALSFCRLLQCLCRLLFLLSFLFVEACEVVLAEEIGRAHV